METARRRRFLRITLLTLLGIGVLWFVIELDAVFGPLLFALLVAYVLNPVVNFVQRSNLPRAAAIGVLFLAFYACLALGLLLTIPALVSQFDALYQNTVGEPSMSLESYDATYTTESEREEMRIRGWVQADGRAYLDQNKNSRFDAGYVREIARWLEQVRSADHPPPVAVALARGLEEARDYIFANRTDAVVSAADALIGALFTLFGILTTFVLVPVYVFYFLMGLSKGWDRFQEWLPGRHRDRIVHVLTRIDEAVSAFFRGRLIVMVIKGVIAGLALWALGLPYALFLGVLTGVGSLIPIAGFLMGAISGIAIALLDTGSPGLAFAVAGIFLVIEIFENYALTPWILKDRVGLHPVTIVVSVFAAGSLFGFVGMLLSVPIASIVKILFMEFVAPELKALASEKPGTPN